MTIQYIETSNLDSIKYFAKKIYIPQKNSHKGQNGQILVIGGSDLFHSSIIWAAEVASYFVDIVHFASTKENNEIATSLKTKFLNGIIIPMNEIDRYAKEDDAILLGPGMVRGNLKKDLMHRNKTLEEIIADDYEPMKTYLLTKHLIMTFPQKKIVFDAGALQMMDRSWLMNLQTSPIITPHQGEFERLFGISLEPLSQGEKIDAVFRYAQQYHCTILMKSVDDIISDGKDAYVVRGGNAGLTKGGTGDMLAGLTAALYAKNNSITSCVLASYLIKKTGEMLFNKKKYWYNIDNCIECIPETLANLI